MTLTTILGDWVKSHLPRRLFLTRSVGPYQAQTKQFSFNSIPGSDLPVSVAHTWVTWLSSCRLSTFSLYKSRKLILFLSLSKNVPILVKNPNSPGEILPPSLQRAKPRLFQPPSLFLKAARHRDRPRFFLVSDVQSRGRSRGSQEAERVRSEDRRSELDSRLAPFLPWLLLLGPSAPEHRRQDR